MYGDGISALTDSKFCMIHLPYFPDLMACFSKQLVHFSILYVLFCVFFFFFFFFGFFFDFFCVFFVFFFFVFFFFFFFLVIPPFPFWYCLCHHHSVTLL